MKINYIKQLITGIAILFLLPFTVYPQHTDSLPGYLEIAARNNPLINSDFALYKASLEKIPQAGAYADPELEIGVFLEPMEILGGKQIADFTLMQMFPWFGTRKAARSEATEMARMAYEKFRESRNNLYYEVKSKWYQLNNLHEQYKNTKANILLLDQLEQLALNRFSASSARGTSAAVAPRAATTPSPAPTSGTMGGMNGMGGSASVAAGASSNTIGTPDASMSGMGGSVMGNGAVMGGMSDVLRIQMEKAELENSLESLLSARLVAEAQFNALLNRNPNTSVTVPDSLEQLTFLMDEQAMVDSMVTLNPMLTMLEAEGDAYRAKAKMDKRMSYPMFGIGLQYSLIGKSAEPMGMVDMNGKDMFMPMVKVSLPIFRRKYNAQQRESKQYWTANKLKYDNALNQLHTEYIAVKQQLEDVARKVHLYTRQHALSLSTYQLIVREFSAGTVSLTDVIQVERQMLDYKLKKSEAIAAYNTTVAGMEKLITTSLNTTEE